MFEVIFLLLFLNLSFIDGQREIALPSLPSIYDLQPPAVLPAHNITHLEDVCKHYGYDRSVLWMDVQWILQGYNIQFHGFFVEFSGFSELFIQLIPYGRLVKSSFYKSFQEIPIANHERFFSHDLFPKEKDIIYWSILKTYPSKIFSSNSITETEIVSSQTSSNCNDGEVRVRELPKALFPLHEINSTESCRDPQLIRLLWQEGVEIDYLNQSSRSFLSEVTSAEECCLICLKDTLCTQWSYDRSSLNCKFSGISAAPIPGSSIGSSTHFIPNLNAVTGKIGKLAADGVNIRYRSPKPKAYIFHGTTCIFQNSTSSYKRDVNTIYIGRYMLERSSFVKGLSLDEYAVSYCSGIVDEIWVPSEWHKTVFENFLEMQGSSHPIVTVIEEAVDTSLFIPSYLRNLQLGPKVEVSMDGSVESYWKGIEEHHTIRKHCKPDTITNRIMCPKQDERFEFLSIFKWEYRKGWDVLLEAYWDAFTVEDQVLLRLRTYLPRWEQGNRNITQQIADYAHKVLGKSLSQLPPIVWETGSNSELDSEALSREQMRDLLETADAFVLPTRGEGWGLPIAEAMSMELPVIVTNATGILAYGNEDNAYLIPAEPYLDDLSFAVPQKEGLSYLFKKVVYDFTKEANYTAFEKGRNARKTMEAFSPASIVCKMNDRLRFQAKRRGWIV